MLVALTEDNTRVYADFAKKTNEDGDKIKYYCPECGGELILRQGTKNIWHFSHKDGDVICHFRKYDNESIQHKLMKKTIKKIVESYNDCLTSELEYKVGSKIADYYFEVKDKWNNTRKIAVECVETHTDIDVFRHKNEYYVKQGVFVLWLFNLKRFTKENNRFKDEVRINEIIKECHTMYYGKVYAIDVFNEVIYGIHLDGVVREVEGYDFIDWSEYEDWQQYDGTCDPQEYIDEHSHSIPSYEKYLKGTKRPNPKLIKEFAVNSFKKAWDKNSLSFLPYRRNVANVYIQKWW